MRTLKRLLRLSFRAVNMVALLMGIPLLRKYYKAPFIFMVYPGTKEDVRGYFPAWSISFCRRIFPTVFPVGFLGKGLVMATFYSAEEMEQDPKISAIVHTAVKEWAEQLQAMTVALAGRAPGIFISQGLDMGAPFVKGDQGTVHAITQTILTVTTRYEARHSISLGVVGGGGFTGRMLVERLSELGFVNLVSLDKPDRFPEEEQRGNVLYTSRAKRLEGLDVVVVLTARGEQIKDYVPYLKGATVVDDTHPQLPSWLVNELLANQCRLYKVALTLDGVRFTPPIPGYRSEWIPGCAWQAVVTAAGMNNGTYGFRTQDEFVSVARLLDYQTPLLHHYENTHRR